MLSNCLKWFAMISTGFQCLGDSTASRIRARVPKCSGTGENAEKCHRIGVHKLSRNYDYLHLMIIINGHARLHRSLSPSWNGVFKRALSKFIKLLGTIKRAKMKLDCLICLATVRRLIAVGASLCRSTATRSCASRI